MKCDYIVLFNLSHSPLNVLYFTLTITQKYTGIAIHCMLTEPRCSYAELWDPTMTFLSLEQPMFHPNTFAILPFVKPDWWHIKLLHCGKNFVTYTKNSKECAPKTTRQDNFLPPFKPLVLIQCCHGTKKEQSLQSCHCFYEHVITNILGCFKRQK